MIERISSLIKKYEWLILLLMLVSFFVFVSFLVISFPFIDYARGDAYSDGDVLIAARNFARLGFWEAKLLPILQPHVLAQPRYYTHLPPLPDLVVGLLKVKMGITSLTHLRLLMLSVSTLALFFFYLLIKRLFSREIAFASLFFFMSNYVFFTHAYSLHAYPWTELFSFAGLFSFIVMTQSKGKFRNFLFLITFLCFFLQAQSSNEYIFYMAVFMLFYKLLLRPNLKFRELGILFCAPLTAVLLRFLQVSWALGGMKAAFDDWIGAFLFRSVSSEMKLANYLAMIRVRFASIGVFGKKAFLFWIAAFVLLLKATSGPNFNKSLNYFAKVILIFFISGISWWIVFHQHTWIHFFTGRHLLPLTSLIFAAIFVASLKIILLQDKALWLRLFSIVLIVLLIRIPFNEVRVFDKNASIKTDLVSLFNNNQQNYSRLQDILEVANYLNQRVPPKAAVFTNKGSFRRIFAYYSDRNVYKLSNDFDLEKVADYQQTMARAFFLYAKSGYGDEKNSLYSSLVSKHKIIKDFPSYTVFVENEKVNKL